ncbi:SAM-dependent methyltransferase [Paracoccaceae bacterium Fryx2]|nr:SAM-dependent methyltransferase [Paracoccaceae bacterium Fryx2]
MPNAAIHFDSLYRANPDPWDYQTSAYEARKYDATLGALTRPRYPSALEAGCSIGVLSARLAARCDRLVAVDFSARAVARAADRLAPFSGAAAMRATLPQDWPVGSYDLIMLSEMIYYLSSQDIVTLAARVARDALPGAECVLVHWQGNTQTEIRPDAARHLFCQSLAALREFVITDHPTTGEYNHRTLLFAQA